MKNTQNLYVALAGLVLATLTFSGIALAQTPATAPAKEETKAEKLVPQSVLKELEGYLARPAGDTREEMIANFIIQGKEGLKRAKQIETEYADAENIEAVRMIMLQIYTIFGQIDNIPYKNQYAKEAIDIATKIVNSKASVKSKIVADQILTRQKIKKNKLSADKEIRDYVARYETTPQAGMAYVYAVMLANDNEMGDLANTLADEMEKKFPKDILIQNFLKQYMGRGAFYGKEFTANLTKLDGSKLVLPKDLKGKVVVIDFWAQWCGPCRASMPHLKEIYAKYKSKGVEIVGINLDEKREDCIDYVKTAGLDWIITFEGKGEADPSANKYGIFQLPSVWVIGKDGKVFSTNAQADLEGTIKRALNATVK